eukprot:2054777-Rhodomonas_salina.1
MIIAHVLRLPTTWAARAEELPAQLHYPLQKLSHQRLRLRLTLRLFAARLVQSARGSARAGGSREAERGAQRSFLLGVVRASIGVVAADVEGFDKLWQLVHARRQLGESVRRRWLVVDAQPEGRVRAGLSGDPEAERGEEGSGEARRELGLANGKDGRGSRPT